MLMVMSGHLQLLSTGLAAVAGALTSLWATYLLGLLVPGPNFAAIGTMSSALGLRNTLSLILGIVTGSSLQALTLIFGAAVLWQHTEWAALGRLFAAALLVGVAMHVWRTCSRPLPADATSRSSSSERFCVGLVTGLSNPITFAGISAQLLGPSAALVGSDFGYVAVLGIALLGLTRSLFIAILFSTAGVRQAVLAVRRPLSALIAFMFVATAWTIAHPLLPVDAARLARAAVADAAAGDCADAGFSVKATTAAEHAAICRGLAGTATLLEQCGLSVNRSISIETVTGDLTASGRLAHGMAFPASQQIKIIRLQRAQSLQAQQPAYARLTLETFYSGVAAHELAHLALHTRMGQRLLPPAAQEYVAYVFQLGSYSANERDAFLTQFPPGTPNGLFVFSTMLAVVDPAHFAALARRHFTAPGNKCEFLERILNGAESFPPDAEE